MGFLFFRGQDPNALKDASSISKVLLCLTPYASATDPLPLIRFQCKSKVLKDMPAS
jgi:hypothetical protein